MKILDERGDYRLVEQNKNYTVEYFKKVELLTRDYYLAIEHFLQITKGA